MLKWMMSEKRNNKKYWILVADGMESGARSHVKHEGRKTNDEEMRLRLRLRLRLRRNKFARSKAITR